MSEDELRTLLDAAGITPHAVWHGEEVGMAGTMDAWIIMQARKDA